MYLQEISGVLQSQKVKIKYDCNGGFDTCGLEKSIKFKYAEKNFKDNNKKHICRKCFLKFKNPMKKDTVKEKVKKTCFEKYGNTMPMNNKENIEKRKELFKDKEYKKQWVEKHKKTNLERYGVDHPVKLESVRNKQKETLRSNYGVEYPYQSKEIMNKMKADNLEKYGVENVASLPEVQVKMAQTTLERYGVEHYNKLPEMREYLRENCREWLAESWANPWAKGISRPDEWNNKARETIANLIIEGKWFGGYGKGKIQGWLEHPNSKCKKKRPYFRSYLELFTHFYFNDNDAVEWYDFEPFGIDYNMPDGSLHTYIVDFIVKFKDDKRMHLIETKPRFKISDPKVAAKALAAEELAKNEGLCYEYYDEIYVNSFGYDQKTLLSLPCVYLRSKNESRGV
jgi:hypothetical protein